MQLEGSAVLVLHVNRATRVDKSPQAARMKTQMEQPIYTKVVLLTNII